MKQRAHRTSDDFRVPEVNRAWHREDGGGIEGGGGAEDGSDVSRILDRVEDDQTGAAGKLQIGKRGVWNLADGENPLRGVSFGRAGELAFVDLDQLSAAPAGAVEELRPA